MGNLEKAWFLFETVEDYNAGLKRYQEIKYATRESPEHKEKMLLAHLISSYESKWNDLPDVDPIELIKIRMRDFGYKSKDLAAVYGDRGTVSKVLSYKQSLSLKMIKKFSEFLHIPVAALIAEYPLKTVD